MLVSVSQRSQESESAWEEVLAERLARVWFREWLWAWVGVSMLVLALPMAPESA